MRERGVTYAMQCHSPAMSVPGRSPAVLFSAPYLMEWFHTRANALLLLCYPFLCCTQSFQMLFPSQQCIYPYDICAIRCTALLCSLGGMIMGDKDRDEGVYLGDPFSMQMQ